MGDDKKLHPKAEYVAHQLLAARGNVYATISDAEVAIISDALKAAEKERERLERQLAKDAKRIAELERKLDQYLEVGGCDACVRRAIDAEAESDRLREELAEWRGVCPRCAALKGGG